MDIIQLYLDNRQGKETIFQVSEKLRIIIGNKNLIFDMVKYPFSAYKYYYINPGNITEISNRAYLSEDRKFVVKYDEQFRANTLSLISNFFGKACKLKSPNMILSGRLPVNPNLDGNEDFLQLIDYISSWEDYSHDHYRSPKFIKQLAGLLAYDLVVGNFDRFSFISRYIDNFLFVDDPEFEQHEIFLDDEDSDLNSGNFGFVGDDLWSIDDRCYHNVEFIKRLHDLCTFEFITECSRLMAEYFHLDRNEEITFRNKCWKYLNRNLLLFPVFEKLLYWALS